MRIRPYIPSKDYEYVAKWVDDERTHAFLNSSKWNQAAVVLKVLLENRKISPRSIQQKSPVSESKTIRLAIRCKRFGQITDFFNSIIVFKG